MSTDRSDTVPDPARPSPGATGEAPPSTAPVSSDDHVHDADARRARSARAPSAPVGR